MTPVDRARRARTRLATEGEAWLASASADGDAHLIPLSYHWDGEGMLFATDERSVTVRNARRGGRLRASLASTDDVVIVEGVAEFVDPARDAGALAGFVARHGWDPRREGSPSAVFRLRPRRAQAWRTEGENATRDVMVDGRWLDDGAGTA